MHRAQSSYYFYLELAKIKNSVGVRYSIMCKSFTICFNSDLDLELKHFFWQLINVSSCANNLGKKLFTFVMFVRHVRGNLNGILKYYSVQSELILFLPLTLFLEVKI